MSVPPRTENWLELLLPLPTPPSPSHASTEGLQLHPTLMACTHPGRAPVWRQAPTTPLLLSAMQKSPLQCSPPCQLGKAQGCSPPSPAGSSPSSKALLNCAPHLIVSLPSWEALNRRDEGGKCFPFSLPVPIGCFYYYYYFILDPF